MRVPDWLRRLWHPRRTIWPTRDGWWTLFAAVGLGVAAVNTGNNLLYLLSSMLLALVVVSGILSEAVIRRLQLAAVLPEELHAGRPALLGATVTSRKRWVPSYSITLEVLDGGRAVRFIYLPRIPAGDGRLVTWEATLPRRGRQRLGGLRVTTRFPFGIFLKAGQPTLREEVLVFPALSPVPTHLLRSPERGERRGRPAAGAGQRPPQSPRLSRGRRPAPRALEVQRQDGNADGPRDGSGDDAGHAHRARGRRARPRGSRRPSVKRPRSPRICCTPAPRWSWPGAASGCPPAAGPRSGAAR